CLALARDRLQGAIERGDRSQRSERCRARVWMALEKLALDGLGDAGTASGGAIPIPCSRCPHPGGWQGRADEATRFSKPELGEIHEELEDAERFDDARRVVGARKAVGLFAAN